MCQARWKSDASFLRYKQKNDLKKTDKYQSCLRVFTGEMYLTMCKMDQ